MYVMALDYQPLLDCLGCSKLLFLLVQLCTNSCSFQRLTVERTLCSNVVDSNVLFQCQLTRMENCLWYMHIQKCVVKGN